MNQIYMPNLILWLEDDKSSMDALARFLRCSPQITTAFGGKVTLARSTLESEVSDEEAGAEIERLVSSAGTNPTIINPYTAQLGRKFFERYIPAAAISDTGFPLNGQKIMEWLQSHEMGGYPLLGLTGTRWDDLTPEVRLLFGTTKATHLRKGWDDVAEKIVIHIVSSKAITQVLYGGKIS
ncbi:hypothetical protein HYU13_06555 [Candidatus Woesearchaeota archaeon]|nr:hypothetical protein [Candidatus Woesearchaeota archaeon]